MSVREVEISVVVVDESEITDSMEDVVSKDEDIV